MDIHGATTGRGNGTLLLSGTVSRCNQGPLFAARPDGEVLGDLNLYEFEGSNPVNATDPLGLDYTVGLLTVDEATKTFEDLGGEKGKAQRKRALDFFKLGGENKGGGRSLIRVDKNVQAGVMKTPIQENEEIEIGKGDAGGVIGFYQIYTCQKPQVVPISFSVSKQKLLSTVRRERTRSLSRDGSPRQMADRSCPTYTTDCFTYFLMKSN